MLRDLTMISSIHIAAPLETVWAVFQDAAAWPRWSRVCLGVWDLSPDLWRVGSRLAFRLRMAGVGVPFAVQVTESAPPRRVAWASTKFTVTATRTFTFEAAAGGALVIDHKVFTSPVLPLRLFYPRPVIRRMTETWLQDLKAEAERRTTP